ncbi:MAG: GIY-YIG nuclease family protein [Anaerolineae bacterium]|nr:GIY-YIG nuclease family protein [Anaerolineae bacterium]
MMPASNDTPEQNDHEKSKWEPEAWLYFIWIVLGFRVYCKIGYSTNPASRYNQLITGIPERPYRIHLLPCLTVEQAKLFESMFHDHLQNYRTRGEWFSHPNARHLSKMMHIKMSEIFALFHTFGYQTELERIDLDGDRPVFHANGFVSHVVDSDLPTEHDGSQ